MLTRPQHLSRQWLICVCFILNFSPALAGAAGWGSKDLAGTSAAVWLIQPESSRLLAMGGASTADFSGVQAWDGNPASLAGDPQFNAEMAFRQHLAGTDMGFLSLACPTGWGVPAVSLTYLQTEPIAGFDALGVPTDSLVIRDGALKLGWATLLGNWSLGVSGTYFTEDYHFARNQGWAGDAGLVWAPNQVVRLGASIMRLGITSQGDPLPAEIRLGANVGLLKGLRLGVDAASPRDADPYYAAGLEWRPVSLLAMRAGWHTGPAGNERGSKLSNFSAGAGLSWGGFSLDYAFEPAGVLGDSHHFSLAYHFRPLAASEFRPSGPRERMAIFEEEMKAPEPEIKARESELKARESEFQAREPESRMVFVPKATPQDMKAKSITFQVKDEQGKIVRTFTFAGQAAPREMIWDGKDNQGKVADRGKNYSFAFEYATDQGVKTEAQTWPRALEVRKLYIVDDGDGIEPQARFRFEGSCDRVHSWRLTLLDRETRQLVRTLTGTGALPPQLEWDGKNEQGAWAPANRSYAYRLELIGTDFSQATLERDITAVPTEMIARRNGVVKFKIMQVLFGFGSAVLRPDMMDRIEAALEISRRHQVTVDAVEGHADEVGSPHANQVISWKRAEAVKKFLKQKGAKEADKIFVQGFGDNHPITRGGDQAQRELNRRVEIVLEVPE